MPKKRYVTQCVFVVVTTADSDIDDSDRMVDVVLLTTDKEKAERCVEVLNGDMIVPGLNLNAPDKDALIAKNLKAIPGAIPYDALSLYNNAVLLQRVIKEEY